MIDRKEKSLYLFITINVIRKTKYNLYPLQQGKNLLNKESRQLYKPDLSHGFVNTLLLAVMGVMHETDNTHSIRNTWLCYWLDQFSHTSKYYTNFVEIFGVFTGFVLHLFCSF